MKPKTPISSAEATLDAVQSVWARTLTLSVVAWLGIVAGFLLSENEFDIWVGNPLYWLYFQCEALRDGWGVIFIVFQAFAFYVWMFTDSFRMLSLATCFIANGLQLVIIKKSFRLDPDWLVFIGLLAQIFIGTYVGWFAYRSFRNRRK